jgi:hypothetical protein
VPEKEAGEGDEVDVELEEEADSIVRRAQDEVALDPVSPPPSPPIKAETMPSDAPTVAPSKPNALDLLSNLSTPKDLKPPSPSPEEDDPTETFDPSYARLAGLKPGASIPGLSQFPVTPSKPPGAGQGDNQGGGKGKSFDVPGMRVARDEDMDSWCCKSSLCRFPPRINLRVENQS